jgi:membrane glycosyltransferase
MDLNYMISSAKSLIIMSIFISVAVSKILINNKIGKRQKHWQKLLLFTIHFLNKR